MLQRYYSFCSLRQQPAGSSSGALVYTKSNPNMRMLGSVRTTPTASLAATDRTCDNDQEGIRGVSSSSTACGGVVAIDPTSSSRGLPPLPPSSSLAPRQHHPQSPSPSRRHDVVDVEGVIRGFQSQYGQHIAKTRLLPDSSNSAIGNGEEYDFDQQVSENDEDDDTLSSSSSSSFGKTSSSDDEGNGLLMQDSSSSSDDDGDHRHVSAARRPLAALVGNNTTTTANRDAVDVDGGKPKSKAGVDSSTTRKRRNSAKPRISHEERLRVTAALSRHRKMLEAQDVDIFNLQQDLEMTTSALVKLGGLHDHQQHILGLSSPLSLQHQPEEQLLDDNHSHPHRHHPNCSAHANGSISNRYRESINDDDMDYDDEYEYAPPYSNAAATATSTSEVVVPVGGVRGGGRSISSNSLGGTTSHQHPHSKQNRRSASTRSGGGESVVDDDRAVTQTQPHMPTHDGYDDDVPLASTITSTNKYHHRKPQHHDHESLLAEVEYYDGGGDDDGGSSSGSLPSATRRRSEHLQLSSQCQRQPLTARTPPPATAHFPSLPPPTPTTHQQPHQEGAAMKVTAPITTCDAATSTPPMGFPAVVGSSSITSSTADLPPFSLNPNRNDPQHLLPSPTNSSTTAVQTHEQRHLQKPPHQLISYDSRIPSGNFHNHHLINNNIANISRSESCLSGTSSIGGCGAPIPIREWEAAASSTLPHHHEDNSHHVKGADAAAAGGTTTTIPHQTTTRNNISKSDDGNRKNKRRNSGGCFTTTTAHQNRRRQSNCSADSAAVSLSDTTPPPPHHIISSATTSRKQHTIQELMSELDELDDDALLLLN